MVYTQPTGSYYAPTIVQDKTIFFSGVYPDYETYYGPGAVISPGVNNSPVDISDAAYVEFMGGDEVRLTDGFRAGDFSDGLQGSNAGGFKAWINKPVDFVYLAPDESQLIDGTLHVKKWEKMELAVKLPQVYCDAIGNFFHDHLPGSPGLYVPTIPPLNPYAFDSLEVKFEFIGPSGQIHTKHGFFMREVTWGPQKSYYNSTTGNTVFVAGSEEPVENSSDPLNEYHFHVRFSPTEESTGNQLWRIVMHIRAPLINQFPSPFSEHHFEIARFYCDPPDADKHGYLEVNKSGTFYRNLIFEDGHSFFGLGENLVDQRNTFDDELNAVTNGGAWNLFFKKNFDDHKNTIDELSQAGGNMVRMIMFPWNYSFMHSDLYAYDEFDVTIDCFGVGTQFPNTPNTFNRSGNSQYWPRKLDELFDRCYEKNIYIFLNSMTSFPQQWNEWNNYGPNGFFRKFVTNYDQGLSLPLHHEFFFRDPSRLIPNTNTEEVEYYWKRYLCYLMSRWGYSINLGILEPFGEINQTIGYTDADYTEMVAGRYKLLDGDMCDQHRGDYTAAMTEDVRAAIDDWYTMAGGFIRNTVASGGLGERNIPMEVSYTDYPTFSGLSSAEKISHCRHFSNPQIDLAEMHRYLDQQNVFKLNFDLTLDVFNGTYGNFNKPFACGEYATFGNIQVGSGYVGTAPFFNNYDISHHNEIWGSAFTGAYHGGFTWLTETSHRYPNSNPRPESPNENARNIGDPFTFKDILDQDIDINGNPTNTITDVIKSTYHHFKPFRDFLDVLTSSSIDLNSSWLQHHSYDENTNGIECYYQTKPSGDQGFGWVHNLNFYWSNKYYYWAYVPPPPASGTAYYNLNGCSSPNIGNGIALEGLNPWSNYDVSFYFTRMATPPLAFPANVQLQADGNGALVFDASILGYLGCDTMTADFAFSLVQVANRPGTTGIISTQEEKSNLPFSFVISPNPNAGKFSLRLLQNELKSDDQFTFRLYDITGRVLLNRMLYSTYSDLDLTKYSKGCYYISVMNNKSEHFQKLIIQ